MSRLETVTRNGVLVEEYDYDAQGRRTSTIENYPTRVITGRGATYGDDDRLLSSGNCDYMFDDDGFLIAKSCGSDITTYDYARNGQLKGVQLPDGTLIEYLHNAAGQRVAKMVNGVITEKYLWAGIAGPLAVYDGSDNLIIRFEGPKMVKNGQTYYLVGDQVGSIRAVVDTAGNIVKEIAYDSFGNILEDTNPTFTIPLGFAGGLHDRDTGLVRFGFRDYDPDTGRWTAKDPILLRSGETDFYNYCSACPILKSDSYGLDGTDRAQAALDQVGSTAYSFDRYHSTQYRWESYKCSAFVADTIRAAGDYCPNINRSGFWGPTAGQWAKGEVPWWVVVKDSKPGDVVAEYHGERPGNTGHCGIVIKPGKESVYLSTKTNRIERGGYFGGKNVVYLRPLPEVYW